MVSSRCRDLRMFQEDKVSVPEHSCLAKDLTLRECSLNRISVKINMSRFLNTLFYHIEK